MINDLASSPPKGCAEPIPSWRDTLEMTSSPAAETPGVFAEPWRPGPMVEIDLETTACPDFQSTRDPQFARDIRVLSQLAPWRALGAIAFDWGMIVACLAAAVCFPQIGIWIAAGVVIAARQHALLILMHDASHFRIIGHRGWNDRLSNWLLAWPLLVSTEGYRQNHFAHHSHLNTESDPDWVRKRGKHDWNFPKTRWQLALLLARDLLGGGFIEALRSIVRLSGKVPPKQANRKQPNKSIPLERLTYYGVVAGILWASGFAWPVLMLWFLPAFTLLPVILRLRSIAEHFAVEGEHELNMSRNTHCSLWERFLLAPHNCGLHLDHHLYPSVPFYNLARLNALLTSIDEYNARSHQTRRFVGLDGEGVFAELSCTG